MYFNALIVLCLNIIINHKLFPQISTRFDQGGIMKKMFMVITFLIFLSGLESKAQFLNFSSREVIYVKSLISETRFKTIWLTNQSVWRLSRPTTFVNLSEIFIVLDENAYQGYTQGVAFINGQEYDIKYSGGQFFYESGFLYKIINKYKDGSRIMLDDYSEWDIVDDDYYKKITEWFLPKYIVLDQNKRALIDPQSQIRMRIKLVEK